MEAVLLATTGFLAGLATGLYLWARSMAEYIDAQLTTGRRRPVRIDTIRAVPASGAGQPDLDSGEYRPHTTA